ncbi:DNA ligase-associated DEXH box helicase [Bryobacterales bacterium F-183]|nr:DNA ligase-associated DEXH box helicase [Bryobacterales bacterium F-183]
MRVEFHPTGIHLPDVGLWLDSIVPVAANWISHAHSDHSRGGHGRILASPETIRFLRLREDEQILAGSVIEPMECDAPVSLPSGAVITAKPAAHITGARQLLVEFGGERLLYTGDIKLQKPLLGAETEIVPCDHLIIESTFGLPVYRFLTCEQAAERIVRFARECLSEGSIPVFLGYPLGRGQEIVYTLCRAGIPTAVHGAIARLIPAHEESGYQFCGWEPYDAANMPGKAHVVTPGFRNTLEASGKPVRIAYVSGWAAVDNARARSGAEELIPYSDHAGFQELLDIVDGSGARRVDVVHGYTETFARILRERRNIDARAAMVGVHVEDD